MVKNQYFIGIDYDRTLFDTGARSPRGIGLKEGYEYAVEKIFGPRGLACYQEQGGLCNRAPSEVISSLLEQDKYLAEIARQRHAGFDPHWQMPGNKGNLLKVLTELLVFFKLRLFIAEIDKNWPKPYPGVVDFFQTIESLRKKQAIPIHAGILSSGHTLFISKTLTLWKIPKPSVIVTDDDLRSLKFPELPEEKVKPAPFPFHFMIAECWLRQHNGDTPVSPGQLQNVLKRTTYIGDDPAKDGGLAKNVRVPFGWYRRHDHTSEISLNEFPVGSFIFSSWAKLGDFLKRNHVKEMFRSGTPLAEIFAHF